MTDAPLLRQDHAGKPIRLPSRSMLTYNQFADLVDALAPQCCSFPDGQRLDPRTKQPCRRERVSEFGCEHHTAREAAKGTRYARFLPKRVRKKFALAATDQELLNIGHDVALISARLHELTARLDTGESGDAWSSLRELWSDFLVAQKMARKMQDAGDDLALAKWREKTIELMGKIGETIKSGSENETIWREITECSTLLANLKRSETSRKRESGQVLDVEQALLFVDKIQQVILDNVKDRQVRDKIAVDIAVNLGLAGIRSTRGEVSQGVATIPAPVAPKQQERRKFSVDEMLGDG